MYKRVLLLLDLEGVNHVVGSSYSGLSGDVEQLNIAKICFQKNLIPIFILDLAICTWIGI